MSRVLLLAVLVCSCRSVESPAEAAPGGSAAPLVAVPGDAGVVLAAAPPTCPCTCDDEAEAPPPSHDQLTLTKVKFTDLPGWQDDHLSEAVPSLLRSCAKLAELADDAPVGHDGHGGKAKQWRSACAAAAKLVAGDDKAARAFFEQAFVPYEAAGKEGPVGKLTGYFVQELSASRKKGGKYKIPILARPKDLVMVDLSKFIKDSHGRRIWGRFDDKGELQPYQTRAEIRQGALKDQKLEIMYADDPVDVLFAHIEGSAKAILDDGTTVWLEFAGKNGRGYRGVGALLKERGQLAAPGAATMPGIRKWFADNPGKFDDVVDPNASYVFFKEAAVPGAVGSQHVILTPRRSMAIDRAFIAHGTPIWVDASAPNPGKPGTSPWRQLLIAQDTGGGILGAVRGDIYWGDDATAEDLGGRMGGKGRYWLLLPRGVTK
jgi:membrane-bound lytic murein transglycosylase A